MLEGSFLFSRPDYGRWFWALAVDEGKAFAAHPVAGLITEGGVEGEVRWERVERSCLRVF